MRYGHPQFGRLVPCICTAAMQAAQQQAKGSGLLAQLAGELGRLRGCTVENFDLDRPLKGYTNDNGQVISPAAQRAQLLSAHRTIADYASAPQGWLYLWGTVGAGKSHLAAAVANAAIGLGLRVGYASVPALLRFIKSGFADESADGRVRALCEVDLLVLDDFGAHQDTAWSRTTLYEILNTRYLYERSTVITSNLPLDALEERVRDRIDGQAVEIALHLSSYRRLNA